MLFHIGKFLRFYVHADQVGVELIHRKPLRQIFAVEKCWSGQQNRQLTPGTTRTVVLTRQDHICRGLKAQKQVIIRIIFQREHVPFFLMGYLLIKSHY